MNPYWNRRRFLRQAAIAGTSAAVAGVHTAGAVAQEQSPNEKLNLAVIGCGGRGGSNLKRVAGENIVALCDVDERRAAAAFQRHPNARTYRDFRKMLDQMHKQIDAVVVSTPDHTHAPAAVMAMKLGKHCYCEKPLTHCVYEARVMAEVAQRNQLATQMGTQIHAGANYRRVVELIGSGAIGPVAEVHVWHGGSLGGMDRPQEAPPTPPQLDWDLWLGPAPYRPYHPCYVPGRWRAWWDFGNGTLGDFGCHYMDLPFWALDLRHPASVEAEGPPPHPETTPPRLTVRYEFPARAGRSAGHKRRAADGRPPVKLTWYNGKNHRPPLLAERKLPQWGAGVLFVGGQGMLLADYGRKRLFPEAKFADFQPPEPTLPDSIGHHAEWILACKTGGPTTCNFGYSGALTEAVLLGNVAYRAGEKLRWDPKKLKAANCPEADPYLRGPYREGWSL